jgi:type II restriction enzyme
MNLYFDTNQAKNYSNNSQIARILTENWVKSNIYCPNCENSYLSEFENNKPVADFFCHKCLEEYELKSKDGNKVGERVVDGAYSTMIDRINSTNNPNFFFLNYTKKNWSVNNFIIIPKHYFVSSIIEKRKPLSNTARRAGWVGCNINLSKIPERGKIFLVKNCEIINRDKVRIKWQSTTFLSTTKMEARGWIIDIMNCIDALKCDIFNLEQVYDFENQLKAKYPNNSHIKDKIRQQLQFLRDKELIEFIGRGKYKKIIL